MTVIHRFLNVFVSSEKRLVQVVEQFQQRHASTASACLHHPRCHNTLVMAIEAETEWKTITKHDKKRIVHGSKNKGAMNIAKEWQVQGPQETHLSASELLLFSISSLCFFLFADSLVGSP